MNFQLSLPPSRIVFFHTSGAMCLIQPLPFQVDFFHIRVPTIFGASCNFQAPPDTDEHMSLRIWMYIERQTMNGNPAQHSVWFVPGVV